MCPFFIEFRVPFVKTICPFYSVHTALYEKNVNIFIKIKVPCVWPICFTFSSECSVWQQYALLIKFRLPFMGTMLTFLSSSKCLLWEQCTFFYFVQNDLNSDEIIKWIVLIQRTLWDFEFKFTQSSLYKNNVRILSSKCPLWEYENNVYFLLNFE